MTTQLRQGIADGQPEVQLSGEVECDEVYVTAGHKGNPEAVRKKGALDGATALKGFGVGALSKKTHPPRFGMIQRGGEVVIRMLANVQQTPIEPLIKTTITRGTQVYTDEYAIYHSLPAWGYAHKTVCHGAGEYARSGEWRWFLRSSCQHNGRLLVTPTLLVASSSWYLSRKASVVLGLL